MCTSTMARVYFYDLGKFIYKNMSHFAILFLIFPPIGEINLHSYNKRKKNH